jgi:methionyl-tRNA synthetase
VIPSIDPLTRRKIQVSEETGSRVELHSETNYKFRLSKFQDPLLDFYSKNPDWIIPSSRMNAVVNEVRAGLSDLSISRPAERVKWGIPVPDDASQTIYVWLDALLNYPVQLGYPSASFVQSGAWPADVHVIGKDILRFHCIYWPAFLMALDLPLPKRVLSHAHWTLGQSKMSKSRGNVVDPFLAIERYGIDALRWYLVHDGGIADDADYHNDRIDSRYRSLRGSLGNMVSRLVRAKHWSVETAVKQIWARPDGKQKILADSDHVAMFNALEELQDKVAAAVDRHDSRAALIHIMNTIDMVSHLPLLLLFLTNISKVQHVVPKPRPMARTIPQSTTRHDAQTPHDRRSRIRNSPNLRDLLATVHAVQGGAYA